MNADFVIKSIGHVLQGYDFSSSLVEQSPSIIEETDTFNHSLICFVNKQPTKLEKTSMFSNLLDEGTSYTIEKDCFIGYFGGLFVQVSFLLESQYDEMIKREPLSYDSVVLMYNAKIIFDKTGEMTKNHKLVNRGGKKLKKSQVLAEFYSISKKADMLEKSYREDDVVYFFNLCEKIKEGLVSLLFAMNGKPFFSFRDLKGQIASLEIAPDDFYSNILLATQVDNVERKIVMLKRLVSTVASLIGIKNLSEEFVSVKKKKMEAFDLRRIVEEKIKSVSANAKPLARKAIDDFKDEKEEAHKSPVRQDTPLEEE